MKRALSLLLIIPFLTVHVWAISGGPYDRMISRSSYSGTYGVTLTGESNVFGTFADDLGTSSAPKARTSKDPILNDADNFLRNTNGQACVGVMTMVVPNSGSVTARMLLFNAGMMYLGNAQGVLNAGNNKQPGAAKMTLLQQMSHYTVRTTSTGIQNQGAAVIDLMLSGPLNLDLSVDTQTGLIEITGNGQLYKNAPMLSAVKVDTSTTASSGNESTEQSVTRSTNSNTSNSVTDATGAIVTTNEAEATTGPSGNQTTNGSNSSVVVSQNYDPNSVRQAPTTALEVFMNVTAVGYREGTDVAALPPFQIPTDDTFFQIDIPLIATGATGAVLKGGSGAFRVV
jgi:hypothetical protein